MTRWEVRPVGPVPSKFRDDYFPRRLHYKKEALELIAEVRRAGGDAVLFDNVENVAIIVHKEEEA